MPPSRPLLALTLLALAGCVGPMGSEREAPGPGGALSFAAPVKLPAPPRGLAFEPSVAVDGQGTVLVMGASPFEPAPLWVSHDDGGSFALVRTTGLPAGIEGQAAFSPDGTAYLVDLNVATLVVARSEDRGDSWERRSPSSFAAPGGDRPWLAADVGGRVYVTWLELGTGQWVAASEDGGLTFPVQTLLPDTGPAGDWQASGPLAVALDGAVLVARAESEGMALYVSRDGARAFTRSLAWPTEGPGSWVFATPAADMAGNVYLTAIERTPQGTRARYAASTDGGATFSPPRDLTGEPGIHVHAWSAAGPEGRLAAAFYENPGSEGVPDDAEGPWFVRLVVVEGAHTASPARREARVASGPVHEGPVCTRGTEHCTRLCPPFGPCVVGADAPESHLGDYLGVAMAPDGVVHVAWQDTTEAMDLWHARTR